MKLSRLVLAVALAPGMALCADEPLSNDEPCRC